MEDEIEYLPLISVDEDDSSDIDEGQDQIPLLPLRNTVLFPGVVIPINVGREKSIKAVKKAHSTNKRVVVVSQKKTDIDDPEVGDLNTIGTTARIVKLLKMPDDTTTVIIQGKKRVEVDEITVEEPFYKARVHELKDDPPKNKKEFKALMGSLRELAAKIIQLNPAIPSEATIVLKNIDKPIFLIHFIASNLNIELPEKQGVLEENRVSDRGSLVFKYLHHELQVLELKDQIQSKVKSDLDKQQRDYILSQQLKTIQQELGHDPIDQEVKRLEDRAKKMKWGKKVAETFQRELSKLKRTNPAAAEHSVLLNYLDTLLSLPWSQYTQDNFDLERALKILDQDHYGLEKVKDRILEYLAVLKLKGDMKSPILCFVGPPGVGKTSLGRSIARSLDRSHVRMALGGLHDEAEIRGHRKTYIGAMPGRIVQNIKKVQSSNPVFILDEVDKVGSDFRGDPSSALLEVLDPEQNEHFYDNYLELEFDLSKVMFVATANTLSSIQPALRDRMEIIRIEGYSVEEKVEIAKKHLVPKQRKAHGLKARDVKLSAKILEAIIQDYTRESGVRELDRQLASIMRNVAKNVALEEEYSKTISADSLNQILGSKKYDRNIYKELLPVGVATGLAYTVVGGEILHIEAALSHGKGQLTLTGNLGNVMKESATTAMSYLKTHADTLGVEVEVFNQWNVHLHVPEGATPKDGPSAGITMLTALTSLFCQRRVKPNFAMTGEITLRGRVLPVGGIKEKVLAAKRAGMTDIILCEQNIRDVEDINPLYIKGLKFHYVNRMNEALDLALESRKIKNPRDLNYKKKDKAVNTAD